MSKDLTKKMEQAVSTNIQITGEDIKKLFCPLATEKEIAIALGIVQSLDLNPFKREVHFIKYDEKSKISIIVGYEVYLKRAERTGKLDGWESGISEDGKSAWVKIHRKDWKMPFTWYIALAEFNKKQSTWNAMPTFMGMKVAIAQGFRLCFPDELGGLPYTQEEHDVYDIDSKSEVKSSKPADVKKPEMLNTPETAVNAPTTKDMSQSTENQKSLKSDTANPKNPGIADSPSDPKIAQKRKMVENLAVSAFKKSKKAFLQWLGFNFGCEKVEEMRDEDLTKAIDMLDKVIKDAAKT